MGNLQLFSEILASTDVLSVLISVLAISLALRSYKIARGKLRLDFYYRRIEIYSRVIKYSLIFTQGNYLKLKDTRYQELYEFFFLAFRESQFLFKEEDNIYNIIEKIKEITAEIKEYYDSGKAENPEAITERDKQKENEKALATKLAALDKAMKIYIQFDSI